MTYSTCTECKDPGFGFQVSTLASIRNMRDVQNKKYSDTQIQTDKLFLQFQPDMLKEK